MTGLSFVLDDFCLGPDEDGGGWTVYLLGLNVSHAWRQKPLKRPRFTIGVVALTGHSAEAVEEQMLRFSDRDDVLYVEGRNPSEEWRELAGKKQRQFEDALLSADLPSADPEGRRKDD